MNVPRQTVKKAILIVTIFLVVFLTHLASPMVTSFDSKWSIHIAMSILREGNTDLAEYKELIQEDDYRIEKVDAHFYSIFAVGAPLLAVPFVYIYDKFFVDLDDRLKNTVPAGKIEKAIASFIIALAAVFIYLIARLFLSTRLSLLLVFIFAYCTSVWSTASRALWQHGPSILMLSITLYIILLARRKPKLIQFASIPLAFSYVIRPTNNVSVFLLTLFVFIYYRKFFMKYLLLSLIIAIPFIAFNISVFNSILSPYYLGDLNGNFFSAARTSEALLGHLISPSRGLFIFTPVLLFSLWGIVLSIRRKNTEKLDYFLVGIIVLHLLVSSLVFLWWGGHAFGPRYMSDMIPYFMYFLIPAIQRMSVLKGMAKFVLVLIFIVLILASFFIHYRGATNWDVYLWNSEPFNVEEKHERVWDWHDIQFLRGLNLSVNNYVHIPAGSTK